jgi:hypothetical protein
MATKDGKKEICYTYCCVVRKGSSFWPFGEIVSGSSDVLVATVCQRKWANEINPNLLLTRE